MISSETVFPNVSIWERNSEARKETAKPARVSGEAPLWRGRQGGGPFVRHNPLPRIVCSGPPS